MKKKSLKGMTLVEIIIAMAVLSISSTVMATACSGVAKVKVSTNALNKRISYQSPKADSQMTGSSDLITTNAETVPNTIKDASNNEINDPKSYIEISNGSSTWKSYGDLYVVKDDNTSARYDTNGDGVVDANDEVVDYGSGSMDTSSHKFKFFQVVKTSKMVEKTK